MTATPTREVEVWSDKVVVVENGIEIGLFPESAHVDAAAALANAQLFVAARGMLAALELCADMAWEETRDVKFDGTVLFGHGYGGFEALDHRRLEIHSRAGSFMIWPSQIGGNALWSVYGGPDGGLWFEKFANADLAKQCAVDELSVICPDHPSVIARAAIALARGETP